MATEANAASELYRQICTKCHGVDGTGSQARGWFPEIPDFTSDSWQALRIDSRLMASILDGRGSQMPPQAGRITEKQARDLVAHVRGFTPTKAKPGHGEQSGRAAVSFAERFRLLQEEQKELRRQYQELSQASSSESHSTPSKSGLYRLVQNRASESPGMPTAGQLFSQRCERCHGADGTGSRARGLFSEIPDFTNTPWQASRTDSQLRSSILDGKGADMPPQRDKSGEENVLSLVAYVRAFAPSSRPLEQEGYEGTLLAPRLTLSRHVEPPEPALLELRGPEAEQAFLEKLIRWLGKMHPPAVHFPIALLAAAAVAEFLLMVTGQRTFDAISRYCIWFGALTAIMAGTLGWCAGRIRLIDASWFLMMHRWLGTATAVCAALVLVLKEASHRPDRRGSRLFFRVMLLVVAALVAATGFFGGAVVFGPHHYTWPQ